MSAHRTPSAPRFGARHLLGGAALTAVFLGAGAGVALADENSSEGALGEGVQLLCDNLENVTDAQLAEEDLTRDGLALLCGEDQDGSGNNEGEGDNEQAGDKADGDGAGDNCGCEEQESKPVVKDEGKNDCPPEEKSDHKSEHKSTESESTPKTESEDTESESTPEDTESVESESTPEVESVASISDVSDETTPVGAAETGDGSSSPGFTPTFAPVADSSPMGEQVALGGGLAAAALLGGFGVQVARRRTGAHRK